MTSIRLKIINKLVQLQINYKKRKHEITIKELNKWMERNSEIPSVKMYLDYLFKKSEFEQYEMDIFEKL